MFGTMENNLNFRGENPGAVQHGNFINYYQFNPVEYRISLLPKDIWSNDRPFVCLDVGCNSGDLTIALHSFLMEHLNHQSCYMLGIDIDPILIQRANEKNTDKDKIKFACVNFMDETRRDVVFNEFLSFAGLDKFNVTFCFSITMWIHLNNGDEGLKAFLEQCCSCSKMVVVEPQPWKCYKTATKRMKSHNEVFPHFQTLQMRNTVETDIEGVLTRFGGASKLLETKRTHNWNRKILLFALK